METTPSVNEKTQPPYCNLTLDEALKQHYPWLNASLQLGFKNPIDEAIIAFKPGEVMD